MGFEYTTGGEGFDVERWKSEMLAALHVIEAFEGKELEEFEEMLDAQTKKRISEMSYIESFDSRLNLLARFAERKVKDNPRVNKVEHVFSTILNGIRSAIEVNSEFEEDPDKFAAMPDLLRKKFEKNRITVLEGRQLLQRAIEFIKKLGWEDSLQQLMEIWYKPSVIDPESSDNRVAWSGGGQELARTLRTAEDPWDPFYLYSSEIKKRKD